MDLPIHRRAAGSVCGFTTLLFFFLLSPLLQLSQERTLCTSDVKFTNLSDQANAVNVKRGAALHENNAMHQKRNRSSRQIGSAANYKFPLKIKVDRSRALAGVQHRVARGAVEELLLTLKQKVLIIILST